MLEIIIEFLTQPNHYFVESFILDLLGVALWVEEFIMNIM